MRLDDLCLNSDRLQNGGWVGALPGLGDIEVKVRGLGCEADDQLLAVMAAGRRSGRVVPIPPTMPKGDRILVTRLANAILLDWRNMTEGEDDTPLPYSFDAAVRFLTAPEFRRFRDGVLLAAGVVADPLPPGGIRADGVVLATEVVT